MRRATESNMFVGARISTFAGGSNLIITNGKGEEVLLAFSSISNSNAIATMNVLKYPGEDRTTTLKHFGGGARWKETLFARKEGEHVSMNKPMHEIVPHARAAAPSSKKRKGGDGDAVDEEEHFSTWEGASSNTAAIFSPDTGETTQVVEHTQAVETMADLTRGQVELFLRRNNTLGNAGEQIRVHAAGSILVVTLPNGGYFIYDPVNELAYHPLEVLPAGELRALAKTDDPAWVLQPFEGGYTKKKLTDVEKEQVFGDANEEVLKTFKLETLDQVFGFDASGKLIDDGGHRTGLFLPVPAMENQISATWRGKAMQVREQQQVERGAKETFKGIVEGEINTLSFLGNGAFKALMNLGKVELSKVATASFLLLDVARLQTMRGLIDQVLGHRKAVEDEMATARTLENELQAMPSGVAAAPPAVPPPTFNHGAMLSQVTE